MGTSNKFVISSCIWLVRKQTVSALTFYFLCNFSPTLYPKPTKTTVSPSPFALSTCVSVALETYSHSPYKGFVAPRYASSYSLIRLNIR